MVNNAGNAHGLAPIEDGDVEDWEAMININVKGLLYVTKAILQGMIKQGRGLDSQELRITSIKYLTRDYQKLEIILNSLRAFPTFDGLSLWLTKILKCELTHVRLVPIM